MQKKVFIGRILAFRIDLKSGELGLVYSQALKEITYAEL